MKNSKRINLSIVIPVFNEEENLLELYKRLTNVLRELGESYEIIFVDDGSKDDSFSMLELIQSKDDKIRVIKFTRNFGHHMAITAGLDFSTGEKVLVMDADLQDLPEEIPKLINKYNEGGVDIVYGYRQKRKDPLMKRMTSKMYLKFAKLLTNGVINQDIVPFRIMSRKVIDYYKKMPERSRFYGGMIMWLGFKYSGVNVQHGQRFKGKTKYGFIRRLKMGFKGIFDFSAKPLIFTAYLGFIISMISLVYGSYILYRYFRYGITLEGWTTIVVSLYFLSGVILIVLGIIGSYLSKIYSEVKNRPLYVIEEELFK